MSSSENRTTYTCGICNTNPDQLSHHIAHLNSATHKEQKIICEYHIRRYVLEFLYLVKDQYWNIYLQNEYFNERTQSQSENFALFEDWIINKSIKMEQKYKIKNISDPTIYIDIYKKETSKDCDLNDEIDKMLFLDWKIQYLIKQSETIKKDSRGLKHSDKEIINQINNTEISYNELFEKFVNDFCFIYETDTPKEITIKENKNNINLGYIIYSKFKNIFYYKIVDVITKIEDNESTRKMPMWIIKSLDRIKDSRHRIIEIINKFLYQLIIDHPTMSDENKEIITKYIKKHISCSTLLNGHLRELFIQK